MASLLERLLSPLARAESVRTWPPNVVSEHWLEVEDFRRRYQNKREDRLAYAPEFSRTAYGRKIYTPIALAREVCNFSAEMLFSAPPTITFEDDEALLEQVLDANGLDARLTAMAALIATEGRGGLRIIYDDRVTPKEPTPLITHVHEDEVIWDEAHGAFVVGGVVVIERQFSTPGGGMSAEVYRLVEEHTAGRIERQLYRGSSAQLGNPVALNTVDEFAALPETEDTGLDVPTLIRWDNVSGGYSDLAGAEGVLDRIDADVSYGAEKSEKARPIAWADATLFDAEGNVDLSGVLAMRTADRVRGVEEPPIDLAGVIQPEFQAQETIAWIDFLIDCSLMFMGYSKASYGRDEGGSADSGKALQMRQARTLLKKAGKDRMAVEAITNALAVAMAWHDNSSSVADYRVEMTLGDGLPRDAMEDAQEAAQWAAAGAISLEEKVRARRPEWDDDTVEEEVRRIQGETSETGPRTSIDSASKLIEDAVRNGSNGAGENPGPEATPRR